MTKESGPEKKLIRKFSEEIPYTQPCGPNCQFGTLLPYRQTGDLNIGYVRMQGPTWNEVSAHTDWHQVYVMLNGKGRMLIGKQEHAVEAPCVIQIPYDTDHAMRVDEGEYVEYLYVNQMLKYEDEEN